MGQQSYTMLHDEERGTCVVRFSQASVDDVRLRCAECKRRPPTLHSYRQWRYMHEYKPMIPIRGWYCGILCAGLA